MIGSGSGSAINAVAGSTAGAVQRIVEHAQVRLECRADANPSDVRYRWYINDEPIIGGQKTEMVSAPAAVRWTPVCPLPIASTGCPCCAVAQ